MHRCFQLSNGEAPQFRVEVANTSGSLELVMVPRSECESTGAGQASSHDLSITQEV